MKRGSVCIVSELTELDWTELIFIAYCVWLGLIGAGAEQWVPPVFEGSAACSNWYQQLQAGGLTLKRVQACLDAKIERGLLENRLKRLDEELVQKQRSRDLLAAMLGEGWF
ncbi:hypothetical protein O9929_15730 [Vibrio lentus]|nr:hypothetical protein [Vibrio lentus]